MSAKARIIRDAIHDAGLCYREVAKLLGMSERTFRRRMEDPEDFRIWELKLLRESVFLDEKEVNALCK